MGLWDKIKGAALIEIIEWVDSSNDTLVYRFPTWNREIKYGARLTVREGQAAVFINQGQCADVFQPGMYTLETKTLPILSQLQGWKYGFENPFKSEVYYVSTRRFTDRKWGTKNPIMLRDAEFGPIRLRAFGTYVFKVTDPAVFIREIVGTDGHFTTDEITDQLRNIVVSRFADALGEAKVPALDLASNYDEIGEQIRQRINPEFGNYGIDLTKLLIENISLPPTVEEALDKRSSMGVIGNMQQYTRYQTAEAIRDMANNPGGGGSDLAAGGLGVGAGFAMGNQMLGAMTGAQQAPQAAPPPPPAGNVTFYTATNGQQAGPFDFNALRQQITGGQLTAQTMVWTAGMANWQPASQVPQLAALFQQSPPPPPGGEAPPPPPPGS